MPVILGLKQSSMYFEFLLSPRNALGFFFFLEGGLFVLFCFKHHPEFSPPAAEVAFVFVDLV